jgi:hypothetical protein
VARSDGYQSRFLPSVVVVAEAEGDFMVAEGDFMVAEGDFMVAEGDFMVAEEGFTAAAVSTAEATLVSAADTHSAAIVAVSTAVAAATAGATAGAADIGAIEDTVMDGDLASAGRIGDGDIRMAMATARGITRPTLIIRTRTTILQTIRRAIQIRTTETTMLHRQIPTHDPSPTRTDLQDPGDPRYREAQPTRTMQTATWRPLRRVGRFSPLTG